MKPKDKQLLLTDLCARLPYGVVVVLDEKFGFNKGTRPLVKELLDLYCVEGMKPYLRPMSSMTEKEEKEYNDLYYAAPQFKDGWRDAKYLEGLHIDWLNAHHFDYRSLIEKGLAIKVTKDNNPYK